MECCWLLFKKDRQGTYVCTNLYAYICIHTRILHHSYCIYLRSNNVYLRTYQCYFTLQTNTFQCVFATSATESFVLFLYADGRIQRGNSALAGFNAGDGINYETVPGSRTLSIATISRTTNVGIPGIWMFKVDEGIVTIYILYAC